MWIETGASMKLLNTEILKSGENYPQTGKIPVIKWFIWIMRPSRIMNNLLYKLTWTKTGYFYIGRTKDLKKRLITHLKQCQNNKKGGKFQHVYNKYGTWDEIEVIKDTLSLNDCKYLEQKKLDRWFGTLKCVNASPSSDGGGGPHTAETKAKIGLIHKGKIISKETKTKMSLTMKKRLKNPKHRLKISIAVKKRFEDPKERIKQSERVKKYFENPKNRLKTSIAIKKGIAKKKARLNRLSRQQNAPAMISTTQELKTSATAPVIAKDKANNKNNIPLWEIISFG